MITRKMLTAVALLWLPVLATPVAAQSFDQQVAHCLNESEQVSRSVAISTCTALLQSGRLQGGEIGYVHRVRGLTYADQGDFAHALADISEAIRLNPLDEIAYVIRGLIHYNQGDFNRAISDYSEAIRLNPQEPSVYTRRAAAHEKLGDAARAAADLDEAARLIGW